MQTLDHLCTLGYRPILLALLVWASTPTLAQQVIYRCVDEAATVIFSDRPCDDAALAYQSRSNLSVIDAADDLESTRQANLAFIEQQRERRGETRRLQRREWDGSPMDRLEPLPDAAPLPRVVTRDPVERPPVESARRGDRQ